MSKGVYRRYRGSRRRVGVLVPTLVILCVLATVVLIYLNANLTQGENGEMILALPFSENTMVFGEKEAPEQEAVLIVEDPVYVEPEIEETSSVPIAITKETALSDELDAVLKSLDGTVDTVVIEIKGESGVMPTEGENAKITAAAEKIKAAGLTPMAQISCFKDDFYAREHQNLACRTKKKVIWLDDDDIAWLNPYSEDARAYVRDSILAIHKLGFDEVLLTNVSFPVSGKTDVLYYDTEVAKGDAIIAFLDEVLMLCDENENLKISVRYDNYDEEISGQSLFSFAERIEKIYVNDIYNNVETLFGEDELRERVVVFSDEQFYYLEKNE